MGKSDCPNCKQTAFNCDPKCPNPQKCVQKFIDCNVCFKTVCVDENGNISEASLSQSSNSGVLSTPSIIGIACGSVFFVFILVIVYLIMRYRRHKAIQVPGSVATSRLNLNTIKEEEKLHGIQSIFTQPNEDLDHIYSDNEDIYSKTNTKLSGIGRNSLLSPLDVINKPEKAVKARASVLTATSLNRASPSDYSDMEQKGTTKNDFYETAESLILDSSFRVSVEPAKITKFNESKSLGLDYSYSSNNGKGSDKFENRFQDNIL
ncbi:hypothetical protein K502DRAFT_347606 [Neoconidiobolus thromboides FSU 785]|nr:hypothetical protein K502DRAFT_347606 [Neoconidiobolus thromboides FSU 785]